MNREHNDDQQATETIPALCPVEVVELSATSLTCLGVISKQRAIESISARRVTFDPANLVIEFLGHTRPVEGLALSNNYRHLELVTHHRSGLVNQHDLVKHNNWQRKFGTPQ